MSQYLQKRLIFDLSVIQNLNLTPKKSLEKKNTNSKLPSEFVFFICGGDNGIRTHGLRVANASLYQLSHIPMQQSYICRKKAPQNL